MMMSGTIVMRSIVERASNLLASCPSHCHGAEAQAMNKCKLVARATETT